MNFEEIARQFESLGSAQWNVFLPALAAGGCCVLLVAIVSYLKRRGKHYATRENLEEILEQQIATKEARVGAEIHAIKASVDSKVNTINAQIAASKDAQVDSLRRHLEELTSIAHSQQTDKLTAMEHKLKLLLKRVKAVSTRTEEIQQTIADEFWLRQTIRTEKKAVYSDVCKLIGGLIHNHERMMEVANKHKVGEAPILDGRAESLADASDQHIEPPPAMRPLMSRNRRLTKALHETRTLLRIYCRGEALRAFDEFVAPRSGSTSRMSLGDALERLQVLRNRMTAIASYDLQLPIHGAFAADGDSAVEQVTCPRCFVVSKVRQPSVDVQGAPYITCRGCALRFEVSL